MNRFTIYDGTGKPKQARGKHQCNLLDFAERYRGWHSMGKHRSDRRALEALTARGVLEVNEYGQFRYAERKPVCKG